MARERRAVERVWYGRGPIPGALRLALLPAELAYRGAVSARNALYDRGVLRAHALPLPAVSVGNLSVGGTGKTPVAADVARRLRRAGSRPAMVLRGYGGDEPMVHAHLNPDVPVVVAADRVVGVERARVLGADVAVLDDAFQHRRARRDADVVLVSADRWTGARARLLPAGPWREPLRALERATLAVVTRKAADDGAVAATVAAVARLNPALPVAVAHLRPDALARLGADERRPLASLQGARVLAVSAIGDPQAFLRQLAATGAEVTARTYPDHHRFTPGDAQRLSGDARSADLVVCTLKDAVKLAPLWPRAEPPVWYVTQAVTYERGEAALESLLAALLRARPHPT